MIEYYKVLSSKIPPRRDYGGRGKVEILLMHMNKLLKNSIAIGVVAMQLAVPMAVLAQGQGPATPPPVTNLCDVISIIETITNWLLIFLIIIAVIFVIMAAFKYLGAGGDSEKVGAANKQIIYAAVAVAIGLLARAVPWIVANVLDVSVDTCSGVIN